MLKTILDALFPPRCVVCRRRGEWICQRCVDGFSRAPASGCPICARPSPSSVVCTRCFRDPPAFDTLRGGYVFAGPIREAIHRLKYDGARYLASPLAACLLESGAVIRSPSVVVPVPLHPRRLARRGYNQSALLARVIAESLAVPIVEDRLQRVKDTPPQVSLPGPKRWANVRDAFDATSGSFQGEAVLLIDDVATTGSTMRAAALALKRQGVARVDALVLARTL